MVDDVRGHDQLVADAQAVWQISMVESVHRVTCGWSTTVVWAASVVVVEVKALIDWLGRWHRP